MESGHIVLTIVDYERQNNIMKSKIKEVLSI